MNETELREARRLLESSGDIAEPLLSDLVEVARALVFGLALPPSVSPYGVWDESVVDDLVADWLINRLLPRGELLSLLDKAYTPSAFRRMAERSLYHYTMSARSRSYSQNIWARLVKLLDESDTFMIVHSSPSRSGRYYTLRADPHRALFDGGDRDLVAAAHATGPLRLARWSSKERLSPLIGSPELARFAADVMQAIGAALNPIHLMTALGSRIDLTPENEIAGEEALDLAASESLYDAVAVRAAAIAVHEVLSERERTVLLCTSEGVTGHDIAQLVGRSAATVSTDQRRAANMISALADDREDRDRILDELIRILAEGRDRRRQHK